MCGYTYKKKGGADAPPIILYIFIYYPSQAKQSSVVLDPKSPLITESVLK